MKELFDFILRFGNLNQQQMDFIANKATEIDIPKEEYFSEAGKIAKQVGFVTTTIKARKSQNISLKKIIWL